MLKSKRKMMGMAEMEECPAYGCCVSGCGMIHFIGGAGVAFLLVEYFGLTSLMTWGWLLVIVAVLGHLMGKGKMMCK